MNFLYVRLCVGPNQHFAWFFFKSYWTTLKGPTLYFHCWNSLRFENLYLQSDFWWKFTCNIFVWINTSIKKVKLKIFQLLVPYFYQWILSIKKSSFLIRFRWKSMNNIFKHVPLGNNAKNSHFWKLGSRFHFPIFFIYDTILLFYRYKWNDFHQIWNSK